MSDIPGQPEIPAYPGTDRPAGPDAESQAVPDHSQADDTTDNTALPSEMEGRE